MKLNKAEINSKKRTKLEKLEERRAKKAARVAKYQENNLHHFEKEIEYAGGLENLLKNKFENNLVDLDYKINEDNIFVKYEDNNYNISYNIYKEEDIKKGIYFQYRNIKSDLITSSIPHDFELFFYDNVLK